MGSQAYTEHSPYRVPLITNWRFWLNNLRFWLRHWSEFARRETLDFAWPRQGWLGLHYLVLSWHDGDSVFVLSWHDGESVFNRRSNTWPPSSGDDDDIGHGHGLGRRFDAHFAVMQRFNFADSPRFGLVGFPDHLDLNFNRLVLNLEASIVR